MENYVMFRKTIGNYIMVPKVWAEDQQAKGRGEIVNYC